MSHLPPEQSSQPDRDRDRDRDLDLDRDLDGRDHDRVRDEPRATTAVAAPDAKQQRRELIAKEEERFGGMRFFLAFFGWLTATGVVVLLTAVATGIGALIGAGQNAAANRDNAMTTGIVGVIVLGVILLVAYYCGGYVAGRMARFNGLKQGVAVWLWAIIIVVLATLAGLVVGSSTNAFSQLGGIPSLPVDGSTATVAGVGALVGAVIVSLIGAILGGLAGMRFHRRVDRFAVEQH